MSQTTVRKRTPKKNDATEVAQSPRRPAYFVSLLPDGTAVGWDQCGTCTKSIQICECQAPTAPTYVLNMIAREQVELDTKKAEAKRTKARAGQAADEAAKETDTATEVSNPDEALVEAAEELVGEPSDG